MIARAEPAVGVRFHRPTGTALSADLNNGQFELVSFAGSLFYLDTKEVAEDLHRLLVPGGTVLVYDFEVLLEPVFDRLGLSLPTGDYDHARNLSSDQPAFLREKQQKQSTVRFEVSGRELAHLLCSVRSWREGPLAGYPFVELERVLPVTEMLTAKTWLTRYAG